MRERNPNIDRAGVVRACDSEWWVVISVSDEEVLDNKGQIIAAYRDGECGFRPGEGRKVAERAARTINAAIRNAVRRDRKERGK